MSFPQTIFLIRPHFNLTIYNCLTFETRLDLRPAISLHSSPIFPYFFLFPDFFFEPTIIMLCYESSIVTTRTVSDCISLSVNMNPASFPEKEFLPANPNHPVARSWQKNKIGDSIIALLEKHSFQFNALDFLRKPRLLAYLEQRLSDNPVFQDDSHTIVITLQRMPENRVNLTEVMEEIHWELVGEFLILFCALIL